MNDLTRKVLAIVAAGISGTLVNSATAAAVLGAEKFLPFALSPGRHGVAVAVATLIPVAFSMLDGAAALALAAGLLTVVPSLLAKLVFGSGAPWLLVLALNLVFAVAAILVYRMIAGQRS